MSGNLTRREQAEQLLKDPNMRRYLDLLSYTEGTEKHGYNTTFGGGRWEDLSHHPNKIWGKTGDGATTATGRYQFLGSTWKEQAQKLGLKDFGSHSQNLAAVSLIMERGAVDDILNGDIDTANRKLSSTWASLPYNQSPHQSQKSVKDVMRKWQQLQMSGGLGSMDGQQYDYSTTPLTAQNTAQVDTPNWGQSFTSSDQQGTHNPLSAFTNYFNQLNGTQESLSEQPTEINYQKKYQNELANAFGIEPSTEGIMPDYIGDLVRSVYDQTT